MTKPPVQLGVGKNTLVLERNLLRYNGIGLATKIIEAGGFVNE